MFKCRQCGLDIEDGVGGLVELGVCFSCIKEELDELEIAMPDVDDEIFDRGEDDNKEDECLILD